MAQPIPGRSCSADERDFGFGHEGAIAPNETAFHALALFEHGAADVGGWTSWALLAAATLLTCTTLLMHRTWNAAVIGGALAIALLPILYILGSSYLFMLPFGLASCNASSAGRGPRSGPLQVSDVSSGQAGAGDEFTLGRGTTVTAVVELALQPAPS